jgi:hypothetical protein
MEQWGNLSYARFNRDSRLIGEGIVPRVIKVNLRNGQLFNFNYIVMFIGGTQSILYDTRLQLC